MDCVLETVLGSKTASILVDSLVLVFERTLRLLVLVHQEMRMVGRMEAEELAEEQLPQKLADDLLEGARTLLVCICIRICKRSKLVFNTLIILSPVLSISF